MGSDQQPHEARPAVSTLAEMGLNAKLINLPGNKVVTATDIDERFNLLTELNTMVIYVALTVELFNSMVNEQGVINAIAGSTLMPLFDKTILSNSPVQAVLTLCYHTSERHVVSLQQDTFYILEVQLNPHAQQVREGQGCSNTFNRIFEIPQIQVEDGRIFRFNSLEINSMAVWEVSNMDRAVNLFNNLFTRYRWTTGYLWSFNTLVDLNKLDTNQQPTLISIIMALEYCGTQCINIFPESVRTKINNLLNKLDRERFNTCSWLNLNKVRHFGVKDQRYLRGAPQHPQVLQQENGHHWIDYLATVNHGVSMERRSTPRMPTCALRAKRSTL